MYTLYLYKNRDFYLVLKVIFNKTKNGNNLGKIRYVKKFEVLVYNSSNTSHWYNIAVALVLWILST